MRAASWPSSRGASPPRTWRCRPAASEAELAVHFAVRRAVFVEEQALFAGSDRDAFDDDPATVHVVGAGVGDEVGGVVRLYPLAEPGLWKGDRLAVLRPHRHGLLGAELVRFAVTTAGALGGERMVAMIQVPNVGFFTELGWSEAGAVEPYHGVDHRPMDIDLRAFSGSGR